ncbi:hypothetical protein RR48_00002 [Papilio machaon]|uniref:Uncharacterized protein n=1 Tax=Papilio machaon TaxID=76193 RepID=A0A0N1IKI2_PAPMA|nr:hypothetical protein RR48_00002 [Papilio machaon]
MGKIEGKRPRGRRPMRWTDQVRTTLDSSIHNAIHSAENRTEWRTTLREMVKRRGRDPQE